MTTAAPLNRKAIEDALYAWFTGATGAAALWRDQKAPKPAYPYGTLEVLSTSDIGGPDGETRLDPEPAELPEGAVGDELTQTVVGHKRLVVSVNAYARSNDPDADARAILDKARAALWEIAVADALGAAGLAFVSATPVQSLDLTEAGDWLSRAQMDVTFGAAANVATGIVPPINTVEITWQEGETARPGWDPLTLEVNPDA